MALAQQTRQGNIESGAPYYGTPAGQSTRRPLRKLRPRVRGSVPVKSDFPVEVL